MKKISLFVAMVFGLNAGLLVLEQYSQAGQLTGQARINQINKVMTARSMRTAPPAPPKPPKAPLTDHQKFVKYVNKLEKELLTNPHQSSDAKTTTHHQ